MTTYRLYDHGYPFKKIMNGKKWVGRVVKCADGRYYGRIGKHCEAYADTELAAFQKVAAKALGFDSVDAVHDHNDIVRRRKQALAAKGRELAQRFQRGDIKEKMAVLDELFNAVETGE